MYKNYYTTDVLKWLQETHSLMKDAQCYLWLCVDYAYLYQHFFFLNILSASANMYFEPNQERVVILQVESAPHQADPVTPHNKKKTQLVRNEVHGLETGNWGENI